MFIYHFSDLWYTFRLIGFGGGDLYTELWKLCAGPLVDVPRPGERVFYFPQGHMEQVQSFLSACFCRFLMDQNLCFFVTFVSFSGFLMISGFCSWRHQQIRN